MTYPVVCFESMNSQEAAEYLLSSAGYIKCGTTSNNPEQTSVSICSTHEE